MQGWMADLERAWLSEGLAPRLQAGAVLAENKAQRIARRWGTMLYWSTYSAVVRRYGVYKSSAKGE